MGLLWSLRPVPGSKPGLRWVSKEVQEHQATLTQLNVIRADVCHPPRLRKSNVLTPMEVTMSVYPGHQTEGFVHLVPLVSVLVERWYITPGVRRIPVTDDGLTGTLFLPSGVSTGGFRRCCSVGF